MNDANDRSGPTDEIGNVASKPWQMPGWQEVAIEWARKTLESDGEPLSGEATLVHASDLGCVLRLASNSGNLFLKATEGGTEAGICAQLARQRPDLVPTVVAAAPDRGLLLLRDAGPLLNETADAEDWLLAISRLAELHRDERLAHCGLVPDEWDDFEELPLQLERLLSDGEVLADWGLEDDAIHGLPRLLPRLRESWARVADSGLSACLCHGDAHPMNVALSSKGPVWFDWNEARRSHPLLDLGWFLGWVAHPARTSLPLLQRDPAALPALWNGYAEQMGITTAPGLLDELIPLSLAERAQRFDRKYRQWRGTTPGWRPQYTPYYLK